MSEKPHYSPSQLATFQRCPLQWFHANETPREDRPPPGAAAYVGRAVHRSVEANLRAKMLGQPIDAEAAKTIARDTLTQEWSDKAPFQSEGETASDHVDKAAALAALHHREVAPKLEPTAIEDRQEIHSPGHGFSLVIIRDIVTADAIHETKTTSRSPDATAADLGAHADQLTAYSIEDRKPLTLDYLVANKVPKVVSVTASPRTTEDVNRLWRRFQVMHDHIKAGLFMPAQDARTCAPDKCGFWAKCEFGARGRTRPAF